MRVAIIGAGPSGLAAARALQQVGIVADGYEASHDVGGLWDITNPRSTMYKSAHLISSRTTTEFSEFPMRSSIEYPSHTLLLRYFQEYADRFGLREIFRFNTRVTLLEPNDDETWTLTARRLTKSGRLAGHEPIVKRYDHIILANGILAEPNVPQFAGEFNGEIMHTNAYKDARQLADKRVLIIGAGNSGCDIAVDAVHHADAVDMSVRRGYYFVPRYLFGRPADTLNQGRPLPRPIKQFVDRFMLRLFTGNPTKYGFPKPDYKLYESHPIVNTQILQHLGQGDLEIMPDIDRFDGRAVHFADGSSREYDLVLLATGYKLDYPFVERRYLDWTGSVPELFLNIFPTSFNGLAMAGMVEASGLGWQGRFEQCELIAAYLEAVRDDPARAEKFRERVWDRPWPDVTAGYKYLGLDRMAYYVNKDAYRAAVRAETAKLRESIKQEATP